MSPLSRKTVLTALACAVASTLAHAETSQPQQVVPSIQGRAGSEFASPIGGHEIELDARDRAALHAVEGWVKRNVPPTASADGAIVLTYGSAIPSIVCAPMMVCDVALQEGEIVNDVLIGDQARWELTPAVEGETGDPSRRRMHIIIKPHDIGLRTSVVITTSRRVYHLALVSRSHDYMRYVSFFYPGDTQRAWEKARTRMMAQENSQVGLPDITVDDLNFNYALDGDSPPWKPIRVFDDNEKTYIQMPPAMKVTEAPALIIIDENGDTMLTNYRVKAGYYIVDRLFNEGALILGVGGDQTRVGIHRTTEIGATSGRPVQRTAAAPWGPGPWGPNR